MYCAGCMCPSCVQSSGSVQLQQGPETSHGSRRCSSPGVQRHTTPPAESGLCAGSHPSGCAMCGSGLTSRPSQETDAARVGAQACEPPQREHRPCRRSTVPDRRGVSQHPPTEPTGKSAQGRLPSSASSADCRCARSCVRKGPPARLMPRRVHPNPTRAPPGVPAARGVDRVRTETAKRSRHSRTLRDLQQHQRRQGADVHPLNCSDLSPAHARPDALS